MRWPSHKDHAGKALAKLAGPYLPATLKQVEKAVVKAHSEHEKASGRTTSSSAGGKAEEPSVAGLPDADALDVDECHEGNLDDQLPDVEVGDVPM